MKPKFRIEEHVLLYKPTINGRRENRDSIIVDVYYNEKQGTYRYIVKCYPRIGSPVWDYYETTEIKILKL